MQLFLGPIQLNVETADSITFDLLPSKHFIYPLFESVSKFELYYKIEHAQPDISNYNINLVGNSDDFVLMPYSWQILSQKEEIVIQIDFFNDNQFENIFAFVNPISQQVNIIFIPHPGTKSITTDPLLQPLGSLLMVYLAYFSGGFLIHASGLKDLNNSGFIFSAISGTGKSTMAKIWQEAGAKVINDDRLWMHKMGDKWHMLSTPMVWYAQEPLVTPVNSVFLIRQSSVNELCQISGINATMRVMSNCIQHFYNKEMTAKHLDRVIDFTSKIAIYDCGFKPDNEIVELIRSTN